MGPDDGVRERRDADAAIAAFTRGTVDPARFRGEARPVAGTLEGRRDVLALPGHARRVSAQRGTGVGARRELEQLPEHQWMVVTLRDMLGFDSSEVCELLEISVANQRVLWRRDRAAVRRVLEDYLGNRS